MVNSEQVKRVIAILGLIALVVISVVAVARIGASIGSDDDSPTPETSEQAERVLSDYATNQSRVVMVYDGAVNGTNEHRAVRISVTADARTFELLEGYHGKVLERETFRNTPQAYATFLRALEVNGFASAREDETFGDDERGVCATGQRTIVELYENNDQILRLWSASCNRKYGTLDGDARTIKKLFEAQITDYRSLVRGVSFR